MSAASFVPQTGETRKRASAQGEALRLRAHANTCSGPTMTLPSYAAILGALALSCGVGNLAHAQPIDRSSATVIAQAQPNEQDKGKHKEEKKGPPPVERKGPPPGPPAKAMVPPTGP